MTKNQKTLLVVALLLIAVVAITMIKNKRSPEPLRSGTSSNIPDQWSLKVIESDQGWEYQIYNDTTLFISQEFIPALNGSIRFKSKEDARACGQLAITKLQNNRFPSISRRELDSIGIDF